MVATETEKNINTHTEFFSFDIFDTLITRRTATPQGIFAIMQKKLLSDEKYNNIPYFIRENFYDYRIKTERYLYSYNFIVNNFTDCTFEEIYKTFKQNWDINDNDINALMDLELQTEAENILPIKSNIEKLKELVAEGKKVVLISDMYHSQNIIRKFLTNIDPVFEDIKIYVSNEHKKKKRDSALFQYVQESEEIQDNSLWEHIGDNKTSDYKSALKVGIKAEYFNFPGLEAYEKFALKMFPLDTYIQETIGIARIAKFESEDQYFRLGCSLAAPVLFPYVCWMLNESVKRGFKRLYFIARDGYILKTIADTLIEKYNLPVSTKYIYGSRLAWQKPSFAVSVDNIKPIVMQYGFNVKFLSKILDINEDELKRIADEFYKQEFNLTYNQREDLYAYLSNNKEFTDLLVNEKTKDCLQNLIGYLKQEIDYSDDNFAFVDLSGSGVTQNCVASVINTFYPKAVNSFYFRNGKYKVEPKNVNRFYYLLRDDICALLELLARAPHGQTIGYKYADGKYEPELSDYEMNTEHFESYMNGVCAFVNAYTENNPDWHNYNSSLSTIYQDWLMEHINQKVSGLLGAITYNHVGKEETEVAPLIRKRDAFKYVFGFSDLNSDLYKLSYARSNKTVKRILKFREEHPAFTKNFTKIRKMIFYIRCSREKKEFYVIILGIKIGLKRLLWGKRK